MAVPAGSLAFPFNTPAGSPIVYLDPTTGALVDATDPVQGELSDILDSGIFTTAYDLVYSYCPVGVLGDWSPPVVRTGFKAPRGNYDDRFYVGGGYGSPTNSVIQAVSTAGTLLDTWELGVVAGAGGFAIQGAYSLAADSDNTVCYYALQPTGATTAQKKLVLAWDLVNDVTLGTFVSDADRYVSAQSGYGLLTMRNGELLVGWTGHSAFSTEVRHYSAAGALLHTYTLIAGASNGLPVLTSALDDLSFWVGFYASGVYYRLQQIQISDGTVLNEVNISSAFRSSINTLYGITWNPDSSFFVTRSACPYVPPDPPGPEPFPPGAHVTFPMRKLRRTPTYSTEKLQNFFTRFQLDFQAGGPREGRDPIALCLRYSDDSGNTWSDEIWMDVDAFGAYDSMAVWFQLGSGRDRVWEVSSTSPALTVWLAAYLDIMPGTHV